MVLPAQANTKLFVQGKLEKRGLLLRRVKTLLPFQMDWPLVTTVKADLKSLAKKFKLYQFLGFDLRICRLS